MFSLCTGSPNYITGPKQGEPSAKASYFFLNWWVSQCLFILGVEKGVVCLVPVSVLLARMPAGKDNAAWLMADTFPRTAGLASYGKRKFRGELGDVPGREDQGRWKDAEQFCTGEIVQKNTEIHKRLPGVILLCLEGRGKEPLFLPDSSFSAEATRLLAHSQPMCFMSPAVALNLF